MKIKRKAGLTEVKFEHNRVLFWIIIALLVVLIAMLIYIRMHPSESAATNQFYCNTDADCVPASCCHADSCINSAVSCSGIKCTQECKLGSLDCGQGSCACVNNKCAAVLNDNGTKR